MCMAKELICVVVDEQSIACRCKQIYRYTTPQNCGDEEEYKVYYKKELNGEENKKIIVVYSSLLWNQQTFSLHKEASIQHKMEV